MDWTNLPQKVQIFEVGPRDGLQNEKPGFIPTADKIKFCDMLTDAGCSHIEVTSFVNPKWVPQMSDAKEVFAGIKKKDGVVYNALVPNVKGMERAMQAGFKEVVTIISASEAHNKNNLGGSVAETLAQIKEINEIGAREGVRVRSYIATVFGCPFEGDIDPQKVYDLALAMEGYGSYEISLGDTTGMASPTSAYEIPKKLLGMLKKATLAVHYHQYGGLEFACNLASLHAGVTIFDGAAGGLGGCPYATGAKGNANTELLVDMLHRMGIQTGIDQKKIDEAAEFAKSLSACARAKKDN